MDNWIEFSVGKITPLTYLFLLQLIIQIYFLSQTIKRGKKIKVLDEESKALIEEFDTLINRQQVDNKHALTSGPASALDNIEPIPSPRGRNDFDALNV